MVYYRRVQDPIGEKALRRRRPQLESQVLRVTKEFGMVRPGERVLVAVSGGADSTALLRALHRLAPELDVTLVAAHLNHCLRGEEADADEDFVRELCTELRVPLVARSLDVGKIARDRRKNLEASAREERIDFLREAARESGAQKVALGHNLNDQAETVLMRLLRGSGPEGMSSIRPILDEFFIRPLIECSRLQITNYLRSQGASYREDSTNRDLRYRRNRVRLELIPYLQEHFNPRVVKTLARNAAISREVSNYLASQSRQALKSLRSRSEDRFTLSVEGLLQHHPALRRLILRLALTEFRGSLRRIGAQHIEDLLALCGGGRSGRQVELPGKTLVVRQFDRLDFIRVKAPSQAAYCYALEVPGECTVPEAGLVLHAKVVSGPELTGLQESSLARPCFDAGSFPETLFVRSRLPGDRYGGPTGPKVKKMLIDARIPLLSRATLPMVVAGKTIIWIPGFRESKTHALRPDSQRCLVLEARPLKSL